MRPGVVVLMNGRDAVRLLLLDVRHEYSIDH